MLTEEEFDLVFANYLHPSSNEETLQYIKKIEALLTNVRTFRTRLIFMEELSSGEPSPIKKLSKQELRILVREGVLGAYSSGNISAKRILSLPHQAESMGDFVDILFLTPIEELAECMKESREAPLPFNIPDIDIREIIKEAQKRAHKPTI